jgi:hypothetical protein
MIFRRCAYVTIQTGMPSDDHPFDALEHQFALENTSTSSVNTAVVEMLSSLPLPWPIDKAVEKIKTHLGEDSLDRIRVMLKTCMDEVRKHDAELSRLRSVMSAEEVAKREETLKELLLDGARKAEATRALERVRRIGMILASSSIESRPINADQVEEMMRIAMNLSDVDVLILEAAIRQYDREAKSNSEARRSVAARAWMAVAANPTIAISEDELASVGAKLQSFGLTSRIEGLTGDVNSFLVLQRGRQFIEYIQSSTTK